MSKQPSFLLTKWYMDCVTESGDAALVYVADLRWNKLSIHYGSLLTVLAGRVHSSSSLRRCAFPRLNGDSITLTLLGIAGTWRALRAPMRRAVFEGEEGCIDWHCHQPMSQVDVLLQDKTRITGLGYAECLTLSVVPWNLPLEELHWGRFLSDQHALVWIDWRGLQSWRTLIHNGDEREIQSLTESEILFAPTGSSLELDRGLVLRRGQLGHTVFAGISRLAKLLPRNMLAVEECKWRSRGVLRAGSSNASGWAIHEIVKWK